MSQWIWQQPDFPAFRWDEAKVINALGHARLAQGKCLGMLELVSERVKAQFQATITEFELEATLAIEQLQLEPETLHVLLERIERAPLDLQDVLAWQSSLGLIEGQLRKEAYQVTTTVATKRIVHYLAPPASQLSRLLERYFTWFNLHSLQTDLDGLIRAAVAYLWLQIIAPFPVGNGVIGRLIIDLALMQDTKNNVRYCSMSKHILQQQKKYNAVVEKIGCADVEITDWLVWFLKCFEQSLQESQLTLHALNNAELSRQDYLNVEINKRQRQVLMKLLDQGGAISTQQYAHVTEVSRATAYRELNDLVQKGCLKPTANKGRNSSYKIKWSRSV